MHLCITVPRIGPYHAARLNAASECGSISVIETRRVDSVYDWSEVKDCFEFSRCTLLKNAEASICAREEIRNRMFSALDRANPDVVAITGWAFSDSLAALQWCLSSNVPAVVMSESQKIDARRFGPKETLKGALLRLFSAGLVGGQAHVEYLAALGMKRETIFQGYDVVDNQHFSSLAQQVRSDSNRVREELWLPEKYFLASNRFIEKKNLKRLLEGYSLYRKKAGDSAWSLVLLGDGELRAKLISTCEALGISDAVLFPGFRQYDELPLFYGLAGAFVHASTVEQWGLVVNEAMAAGLPVIVSENCGCARDLVMDGENGFRFNPHDIEMLSQMMCRISSSDSEIERMGRRSRELISEWCPTRFAEGIWNAASAALSNPSEFAKSRSRRAVLNLVFQMSTC